MSKPQFAVILPAAGNSTRFQHRKKKVFVELRERPVWLRAVDHFVNRPDVAQVLVVVSPDDLDWFKQQFAPNLAFFMNVEIVTGGAERADSVRNALEKVRPEIEFVAVHDAARPLLAAEWIDNVFAAALRTGAAILATPVTQTLKRATADGTIETTVSRERLWAAQTPQVFRKEWLVDAYARRAGLAATDEAQLVEQTGRAITLVDCPALNIKITTESDLRLAEVALDALPKPKVLRPLHPFADDDLLR